MQPNDPTYHDVVVAIATAVASVGATVGFAHLRSWLKSNHKDKSVMAIKSIATVYDLLNQYVVKLDASRALIEYTSNGGGIPDVGKEVKMTVLYELLNEKDALPIRHFFQQTPIDAGYADFLRTVIKSGHWEGTPEDLTEGFLKDQYLAEGVIYTAVIEIERTPRKYYYLAFRWTHKEKLPEKQVIRNHLFELKSQLTPLFKNIRE